MQKQREREQKNIEFHYDLPASFFKLFLGKTMNYTSALFARPSFSLDQAQYAKMDQLCRLLELKKGDQVLDVGCGFGGFIVYAAKKYGVFATGITLSKVQYDYARAWIKKEKLEKQCTVQYLNYRDLDCQRYDKIISIEMTDHVGSKNLPGFFRMLYDRLKPNGFFVHQTIATRDGMVYGPENRFMNKYIFPGGELIKIHDLIRMTTCAGFELCSVKTLRKDYARTLREWVRLMGIYEKKLCALVSEEVYRAYRIYWAGCALAYDRQSIMAYHVVYQKNSNC